jgi:ribonuclease HI
MLNAAHKGAINWDPHANLEQSSPLISNNIIADPYGVKARIVEISLDTFDQLACPFEDRIYAFVDGSASKNGQPGASARYAAIILDCCSMYKIVGTVPPITNKENKIIPPTNNRAELMAIRDLFIYAASEDFIHKQGVLPLVIVYDSAYAKGCVCDWYEKWRNQTKPEIIKANLDIIPIAYEHMKRVENARYIIWVKIASHKKEPEDTDSIEWYHWLGNKKVDEICSCETCSSEICSCETCSSETCSSETCSCETCSSETVFK